MVTSQAPQEGQQILARARIGVPMQLGIQEPESPAGRSTVRTSRTETACVAYLGSPGVKKTGYTHIYD